MRSSTVTKLLFTLFLCVFSGAVCADPSASVISHTDLSVSFLSSMFGTVGNVLQGSSGQMLGMLFLWFNKGILVVAGLWLAYTSATLILRAAQEGSMQSNINKNGGLMLFCRIALGIGMLIPNATTGYSLLQVGIMKSVVAGVSLADNVWSNGLNYLQEGGVVWHQPFDSGGGKRNGAISFDKNTINPIVQIYANEVCMYKNMNAINKMQDARNNMAPSDMNGVTSQHVYFSPHKIGGTWYFPATQQENTSHDASGSWGCGSVSPYVSNTKSSSSVPVDAGMVLDDVVANLQPTARMAADPNSSLTTNQANDAIVSNILSYANSMLPFTTTIPNSSKLQKSLGKAGIDGWITAGRYYWDLSVLQSRYKANSSLSTYFPAAKSSVSRAASKFVSPNLSGNSLCTNVNLVNCTDVQSSLGAVESTARGTATNSGYDADSVHGIGNKILRALMGPVSGGVVGIITDFDTSGTGGMGADPILFLHHVGMDCLSVAEGIWFESIGLIMALLLATGVCTSTYNAQFPIGEAVEWIKPALYVIATMFFGIAVVLGFYVPLYPFIIFTFGVISWMIAVLEALVAAPLVALGLTHPEGHDFMGKAEQALMIILGVFLRPALMIIGLIAAMILSYVSLRFLVYSYTGFLNDLFSISPTNIHAGNLISSSGVASLNMIREKPSISSLIYSIVAMPIFLAIFASIVYAVVTQCYSLVYVLPDNILRWIGGPQTPSSMSPQQMAEKISGQLSSGVSSIGQAADKGIDSYRKQKPKDSLTGDSGSNTAEEKTKGDASKGGGA